MAKMSDELIIGMIQQHLVCLQRFIKADELSVMDLEFMVNHAWEIEWLCQAFAEQKKKEDKN
nr:MAG TPA: hypothetical protein [Bacteriophage sp.]